MNIIVRKNNAKQYINENIINIEKQIKLLNKQKKYYQDKLRNLEDFDTFTKEELKELIEYLVSSFENEKYVIEKFHINTKSSSYNIDNLVSEYTFLYLVKENNRESAIKQIKEKYQVSIINGENYIKNIDAMNNIDINNDYVKLSFYNRYSSHEFKFSKEGEKLDDKILINIQDDRFEYINVFINYLLNKKLDTRDFKLSISEMKLFADYFVENNKNEYKKIYTNS